MTVNVIQNTDRTTEFWVLRARGVLHRGEIGKEVDLVWTIVRGMTDSGQPAWDTSGTPIGFDSAAEALATLARQQTGYGWNFKMISGSGVILKRTERHRVEIVEE